MAALPADITWRAQAAANLLEANRRRGRIGTKKARTGCLTCKSRRIKCDEGHPLCKKCSSTGRKCSYPPLALCKHRSPSQGEQDERKDRSFVGRQLSESIGLKEKDKRTFEYFLSWAAPRLAGTLDFDFWCSQVLVLARSETAILDALLAMSVLYEHPQFMKSHLTSGEDYPTPQDHPVFAGESGKSIDSHHSLALQHFNRSIQRLREQIASDDVSPTLAIVSCLLYIAVETMRDNIFAARALLTHGANMLKAFSTRPSHLMKDLLVCFRPRIVRLAVLAATYGYLEPLNILGTSTAHDPAQHFTTVVDARNALYEIIADAQKCLPVQPDSVSRVPSCAQDMEIFGPPDASFAACATPEYPIDDCVLGQAFDSASGWTAHDMDSAISQPPAEPSADQQWNLKQRLTQWLGLLEAVSTEEDETICNLLMLYHVSWIAVSNWSSPLQESFDDYAHNFQEIVRLARKYQESKNSQSATFSMETGAVGPLFYVATKCRIPSLRRAAISLMPRGTKKESMFGAKSTAEVAARIVAIEEEDWLPSRPSSETRALAINDSLLPPEDKRINRFEILINRPAHLQELRVTRYFIGLDGRRIRSMSDYPI